VFDKKRPRIQQKCFVHHNNGDTVHALLAASLRVLDSEDVAQHLAALLVTKEYGTLAARISGNLRDKFTMKNDT